MGAFTFILTGLVTFTSISYASSKAQYLLKDEYISGGQVLQSFNLRASDGSVLAFLPRAVRDDSVLQYLPAERGADQSICSDDRRALEHYLTLNQVFLRLVDLALKNTQGQLTAAEVSLIERTPRCGRLLETLRTIASILHIENRPQSEELDKLGIVKTDKASFVELKTKNGASAFLQIASGTPKKVKSLSDLSGLVVRAESSGQNLSLQLALSRFDDDQMPSDSHRTEPCTITRQVRICERGECHIRTITETGVRYVSRRTTFDMTTYELRLLNQQNQVVFRGEVSDGEFDSEDTNTSMCYRH